MDLFDVVTIGNAKVDIFLQVHDTNKHFRLDHETGELCIKSGDKALIDQAYFLIGGNAANVSIGIARAGFKSAIVAEVGSDEFADKIINILKKENVSEQFLKQTEGASSISVILNYMGERTIFEENVDREHNFSFENLSAKWIYLTSMGNKWHDPYRKTLDKVLEKNIKLAFNPGTLQLDEGVESFQNVLSKTEILFVNREEGIKISKANLDFSESSNYRENIEKLLIEVKNTGPKNVVLTDGKNGSFMIDSNGTVITGSVKDSEVVERTGAGDAFASGFLSGILAGKDFKEAMNWGAENASSVIGQTGATKGLLRREEIENLIKN